MLASMSSDTQTPQTHGDAYCIFIVFSAENVNQLERASRDTSTLDKVEQYIVDLLTKANGCIQPRVTFQINDPLTTAATGRITRIESVREAVQGLALTIPLATHAVILKEIHNDVDAETWGANFDAMLAKYAVVHQMYRICL